MNIAVVGTGYVGLVTGTCLAETGNRVVCVDINQQKVKMMQEGHLPIYEPGLEQLFHRNIIQERLHFTTKLEEAITDAEIIFMALPTPPGADGSADLTYILNASADIARLIKGYKVIITKSTVPVGTADMVKEVFEANTSIEVDVVSNPEFLREGVAVEDFMRPDRIVIGTESDKVKVLLSRLYQPYVRQGNPIIFMDQRSSELTKYAANSFLATKITFMNEIANLCEKVGADVDMVRLGIGTDDRIGKRFLFSGIGYGGSCFPKDVQALSKSANENEYDFKILNAVMDVNEKQKSIIVKKAVHYFNNDLSGLKFAVWGLAFKPETDDIREAPAITVIRELLAAGATVTAFDPEAINNFDNYTNLPISYGQNPYEVLDGADALLILTEWAVFRNPDFGQIQDRLKNKVIFDGRNLYDVTSMEQLGFYYNSIGRPLANVTSHAATYGHDASK